MKILIVLDENQARRIKDGIREMKLRQTPIFNMDFQALRDQIEKILEELE